MEGQMSKLIDLTGKRFGRLVVIGKSLKRSKHRNTYWFCQCDCGEITCIMASSLRFGNTQSCGCLRIERTIKATTKHGLSGGKQNTNRIYRIWRNMKSRCLNSNTPKFKNHGGRGVFICREWLDFENFYNWAIQNGYADNLTLERINNNEGYYPTNCEWTTYKKQNFNKRVNRIVTYRNESRPLMEWSNLLGFKFSTLWARLYQYNWSIDKAFEIPTKRG